jgi:cytochrome c oxidase cbb3-type subunit 2
MLGDPYTDADIAGARAAVTGKTEIEAVIAYLQGLGTRVKFDARPNVAAANAKE